MFMGEYNHTIDEKGRIIVPAKYREQLGENFVVTCGTDGCLFLYPNEEWERIAGELKAVPANKDARRFQRMFLASATLCDVDKQGRILIPTKLREHAALEKEVVFIGVLSKIEIWSKERWEQNDCFDDMDELAERMAEYNISF